MMFVSSVAPRRITSAASFTSSSERSLPPAIESRIPFAPIKLGVDQRRAQRALGRLGGAVVTGREADAHQGRPGVLHDRADVGEVEVDQAGKRDQVGDPLDALAKDVVGDLERVEHRGRLVEHLEQPRVRDHDRGVAVPAQLVDAGVGLRLALRALERERRRHDADRQRAEFARDPRDDRRRTGAGAAAFARGHEDHVGAAERVLDLVVRLFRGCLADPRVGPGAEALGQVAADVELHLGVRHLQLLQVGVDRDELDLADPGVHHPVDRVQPRAADADDADDSEVRAGVGPGHTVQARCRLGQRLEARDRRLVARHALGLWLGHGGE